MKKILLLSFMLMLTFVANAQIDSVLIEEVSVVSFYRNGSEIGTVVSETDLSENNYGQDPAHLFATMPSIISLNDNGTDFGYGYFRIRGLDQTRINVSLDGCPWNEAEDFGSYFANSPDLMSSMKSIKVERGGNSSNNGVAGSAGGINMESIDIFKPHKSHVNIGIGTYNTYKGSVVYNMIPSNDWGLHIKATHQQTDGYRDYAFNNSQALTVKTGYKFNKRHTIDFLTMNGFHRNVQGWLGCTMDELIENPKANGCTNMEDDNWFMSMNCLQYKGRLSANVFLTSSIYLQVQDGGYRMDLDNYLNRMKNVYEATNMLYDYHLRHYMGGGNVFAKFYLNDFTLTAGVNGYSYRRDHYMGKNCVNVPISEYYSNYGVKNDVNGLINFTYNYYNKLNVGANAQFRMVQFKYYDTEKYGNPNGDMTHLNKVWPFINYGAFIEYRPHNIVSIYVRYNHLNREPTRSDMFGGNEWFCGTVTTKPEISDDIEFGVDAIISDVFTINVNAYYMMFKNELVLNGKPGSNGLPCHENAFKSYRRGIEASMDWRIIDDLHYTLNGSISENKVDSPTFGLKNHVLSPSANAFTEISWRGNHFEVGVNYLFRSKMYVDMANNYSLPYSDSLNAWFKLKFCCFDFTAMINSIEPDKNMDFCTGMVNDNGQMLYIQNSPFDIMCQFKYYF